MNCANYLFTQPRSAGVAQSAETSDSTRGKIHALNPPNDERVEGDTAVHMASVDNTYHALESVCMVF